jgi:hypothetical protein
MTAVVTFNWLTVTGSLTSGKVETGKSIPYGLSKAKINCLDLSTRSCFDQLRNGITDCNWDIVFIADHMIEHSLVRLAAKLAKRNGSLLVGLVPGMTLSRRYCSTENLRLMIHSCDMTILVNSVDGEPQSTELGEGLSSLGYSNVISKICQGLVNDSNRRALRDMLKRGQLARVNSVSSHTPNIETGVLNVLRKLLPVAEFVRNPEVFLSISSRVEIDKKTLARASEWISRVLAPADVVICSNKEYFGAQTRIFFLVTGIAFPYSSARNLPIDIDDIEPESSNDGEIRIPLELDQLE